MTAPTIERVRCPHCSHTVDNAGSLPAHVAMAHKDVPMDVVAPKRSAGNDEHTPAAPAADPSGPGAATLAELPLDLVDVGDNVRVDVAELEELAASIAEHGVLQPVKAIAIAGGRYRLVWGQRRTLAARQAGLATIPAIVVDEDLAEASPKRSVEQLVENLHRADLNPIDRARAMRDVVDSGVSQADLARKLGIAPSTVANDLRLLGLDERVIEQIRSGHLTASHGKAMASLPASHQKELAGRIVASKLSAHQVEGELEWRRNAAGAEEARAERTRKQLPKLLAVLDAQVPKTTAVRVMGAYNVDADELAKAVVRAGWTLSTDYPQPKPPEGQCDCKVAIVEFSRAWKVAAGCVDHRHRDRQRNIEHQASEAQRQEAAARQQRIAESVALGLANVNLPTLRVLAVALTRAVGYWGGRDDVQAMDRDAVMAVIGDRLQQPYLYQGLSLEALVGEIEAEA